MSDVVLTPLEHIRELEKYLLKDIAAKPFNLHEGDDLTIVIAALVLWLATHSKYGLIANVTKSKKQEMNMLEVVALYEEWIKTGIKPSKDIWEEKQLKVNTSNSMNLVNFYEYVTELVCKKGIPLVEIRQAQYDHIQDSIYKYSNSALYSFDDYEKE